MSIFALLLLTMESPPPPAEPPKFSEEHGRTIDCIAYLGIMADKERRGVTGYKIPAEAGKYGRQWAGIAGSRLVAETGQPRDVVAMAIAEAALRIGADLTRLHNPYPLNDQMNETCVPLLYAELAAAQNDQPLPKPQK
jgi:hypothetical protein